MFKKTLLVACAVLFITGCDAQNPKNVSEFYKLPDELSHCGIYRIDGNRNPVMRVVVCPNSTTTTQYKSGKTTVNNSVYFDGDIL